MSREARWLQVNVQGPRADSDADTSLVRMGQIMSEAEARGLITGWFFIRKLPGGDGATSPYGLIRQNLGPLSERKQKGSGRRGSSPNG
jgi:hypothetical protein